MVKPPRIVAIGEGMTELADRGDGGWSVHHGGDVLNTAIHLARSGCDIAFASALGRDPFSQRLRAAWEGEGLDCSLLLDHPTRGAGLYAISVDPDGERSFTYWRDQSAARDIFGLPDVSRVREHALSADLLYFSLISLAILPPSGQDSLIALAGTVRKRGGRVAFDGNFRPALWESLDAAVAARDAAIRVADIGLPTWEDERQMSGVDTPEAVAAHWAGLGCDEVVVKLGAQGCRLPDGATVSPPKVLQPRDTSGAGDAFNAGYLASRLAGGTVREAARRGHELAGWTVMRPGAVPARDALAPY
ncbi:sugar kinase [Sphingomonas tabacisoli]|uniref:Sugar kinase n=1 Tax=Sphingomonas tabacisoli TaxID=2249466 RepID=A0ABW4I5F5_9SPHN